MKNLILILAVLYLFLITNSCGTNNKDLETSISFYESNFEFVKTQKDIFRMHIERIKFDNSCSFSNVSQRKITDLDSLYNNIVDEINKSLLNSDLDSRPTVFNKYSKFINDVDTFVGFEENLLINRLSSENDIDNSKLFFLRMKNDLTIAYSNCLQYILYSTDCASMVYPNSDILTSHTMDSSGKNVVILHSKVFQNFPNNGSVVNSLIVDGIVKNGEKINTDIVITKSNAFANISFNPLEKGSYSINGKMRVYGYKGVRDYPFEHQFNVDN